LTLQFHQPFRQGHQPVLAYDGQQGLVERSLEGPLVGDVVLPVREANEDIVDRRGGGLGLSNPGTLDLPEDRRPYGDPFSRFNSPKKRQ